MTILRSSLESLPITIPDSHLCPITHEIMADPVFTADGHTYEREAIEHWLSSHDTNPVTMERLANKNLVPNRVKKSEISEFLTQHPALKSSEDLYLPVAWITELLDHLEANRLREVQAWFSKDVRLVTRSLRDGYSAFYVAAQFASPELAEAVWTQLEAQNALWAIAIKPLDFQPIHLNVLLERALDRDDIAKADAWLKLGAELENHDPQTGNSLLARCVCRGKLLAVQWLIEQGASLSSCNLEGNSPLHLAVMHHQPAIAAFFLFMKADRILKNRQGQSPLMLAVLGHQRELIAVFLEPERAVLPVYHIALALNDRDLIEALLAQGMADINACDTQQRSPLGIASQRGDVALVRSLLARGAALEQACGFEQERALHLAAKQGHSGVVTFLIDSKAELEATDLNGNTPLHAAAQAGSEAVCLCLLEAGAYHKAKNHQNQTPIDLAHQHHHVQLATLIAKKARALKQAKLETIGILHVITEEQSTRIKQLEAALANQSRQHAEEKRALQQQMLSQKEALEKQIVSLKGTVEQHWETQEQRLTRLDEAVAELQPTMPPAPLVFSSPPALKLVSAVRGVTPAELSLFLRLVAEGDQDKAEAMLQPQNNPELVLFSGNVSDLSGRTFENITGFQYAVWALDRHMWTMLRRYLPDDAAAEQLRFTGPWVSVHGLHAGMPGGPLDKLQAAYQAYMESYSETVWQKQVGGAQLLLPAHVINEYCRPDRPFYPCPNFEEPALPRTRAVGGSDWFTAEYNGGKLGDKFCIYRGPALRPAEYGGESDAVPINRSRVDAAAVAALTKVRTQQRDQLASELSSSQQHTAKQGLRR